MTIGEFKSFLLTLTDNVPFHLKFMMNNNQTLGDLKKKIVDWNTKYPNATDKSDDIVLFERDKNEKFMLQYEYNGQKEFKCNRKTKLEDFRKELNNSDKNKDFKMTFVVDDCEESFNV